MHGDRARRSRTNAALRGDGRSARLGDVRAAGGSRRARPARVERHGDRARGRQIDLRRRCRVRPVRRPASIRTCIGQALRSARRGHRHAFDRGDGCLLVSQERAWDLDRALARDQREGERHGGPPSGHGRTVRRFPRQVAAPYAELREWHGDRRRCTYLSTLNARALSSNDLMWPSARAWVCGSRRLQSSRSRAVARPPIRRNRWHRPLPHPCRSAPACARSSPRSVGSSRPQLRTNPRRNRPSGR